MLILLCTHYRMGLRMQDVAMKEEEREEDAHEGEEQEELKADTDMPDQALLSPGQDATGLQPDSVVGRTIASLQRGMTSAVAQVLLGHPPNPTDPSEIHFTFQLAEGTSVPPGHVLPSEPVAFRLGRPRQTSTVYTMQRVGNYPPFSYPTSNSLVITSPVRHLPTEQPQGPVRAQLEVAFQTERRRSSASTGAAATAHRDSRRFSHQPQTSVDGGLQGGMGDDQVTVLILCLRAEAILSTVCRELVRCAGSRRH